MIRLVLFFALLSSVALAQDRVGLSVDPAAGNIAVLFTMTDEGGRLKNLELMKSVFEDGTLGFALESHHNVSSPFIYEKLQSLAASLPENGTLLAYLNSHGGGSGDRFAMTAKGGSFKFSKALESLKANDRPVRRLILLVDTCHAAGSIQDSTGEDGQLLRGLSSASPTSFLPEMPSSYSRQDLPFISPFVTMVPTDQVRDGKTVMRAAVDYGEGSGAWEELLIISSSSVEDLSVRGLFAARLAETFKSVKGERGITVGEFLKRFAESHGKSGQQPHYKVLPSESMFGELLFGPWPAQTIPVRTHEGVKVEGDYVPVPRR